MSGRPPREGAPTRAWVAAEPLSAAAPELLGGSIASQRWSSLTFLHWRVESDRIRPLLPQGLRPDEFDGSSWVGLIPFVLDRARLGSGPALPYVGDFVEVNVRYYAVDERGRRGVVFGTLEASRLAAVLAARTVFSLPYRWAATRLETRGDRISAASRRLGGSERFAMTARVGDRIDPTPLDTFLTARWSLFVTRAGQTRRLDNEHEPWPLHRAELEGLDETLLASCGLPGVSARPPDSVMYSPGVTTRFARWAIPDSN